MLRKNSEVLSLCSHLCNLVLNPEHAFSLITIHTSSENLGPTIWSADGHSEKWDGEWVADMHKIWFTNVSADNERTSVGNF